MEVVGEESATLCKYVLSEGLSVYSRRLNSTNKGIDGHTNW